MKKREKFKRLFRFLNALTIIGILTAVFAYMWYTNFADNEDLLIKTFFRWGNYALVALYAVIMLLFYRIYGAYEVGYMRLMESAYTQVLSVLCANAITYLQLCLIGRWKFLDNIQPVLWITMIDLALVVLWAMFTRFAYLKIYPPRKVLLVYGQYNPKDIMDKMASRQDKYIVSESINIDCGLEAVKDRIEACGSVLLMDIPASPRNQLLKYCFRRNIRCYCVPKISDIMLRRSEEIHLFDTTLLLFRNAGLSADQQFVKRFFDVVFSLMLLVLASPVMLIIAVAVKACDGGPVIFTQDRLTQDNKVFKLYKFRSMYADRKEAEYCLTRQNDTRITPVGKLIRNLHLDELPQVFNILKGDMSFVGPRPECPELAEKYRQMIPEFDFRLKMKAGLTGYAQVYGKYNTTPLDKLKLDMVYIERYSFWLDLKLILLTVKVLFQKENTEGIKEGQTTAAPTENLEKIGKM